MMIINTSNKQNPLRAIIKRGFLLISALFAILLMLEYSKIFAPPDSVHAKSWNAYHAHTAEKDIDILFLGNSKMLHGVDVIRVGRSLGAYTFCLGMPGTFIQETSFVLEEAVTKCHPKVVVLELATLSPIENHDFKPLTLSYHFKSFAARRNLKLKMASTPALFARENYVYAWSETIRNHEYLYKNTRQLKQNLRYEKSFGMAESKKMMGGPVSEYSPLTDSTIAFFEQHKKRQKLQYFEPNASMREGVNRIKEICQRNQITLLFLSTPVYPKFVEGTKERSKIIAKLISSPEANNWLDLFREENLVLFSQDCFENKATGFHHMTKKGIQLTTDLFLDFFKQQPDLQLPDRRTEARWKEIYE